MTDQELSILLAEYNANIEMWKHDDDLRQKRTSNFLTVNTILLAMVSASLGFNDKPAWVVVTMGLVGIFGIILCIIWKNILSRNAAYIKFRRFQLQELEHQLKVGSTFTKIYQAFYENQPVQFHAVNEAFELKSTAKKTSTLTEGRLPVLILVFWILLSLGAILYGWIVNL